MHGFPAHFAFRLFTTQEREQRLVDLRNSCGRTVLTSPLPRRAPLPSPLSRVAAAIAAMFLLWASGPVGAAERTLQLVTDSACEAQIPEQLAQWEADRKAEGWKVLKRIVCTPEAPALRVQLVALRPDHTFLVGDGVPFLRVVADPDGHGARKIVADYRYVQDTERTPFGAIGRVWFKNQAGAKATSMNLYRRYFARRHTWEMDRARLGPVTAFDDHLSYRPDGAVWAKTVAAQVPPNRLQHLHLPTTASDGELARRAISPRLIEIVFSGGLPFVDPGGLYYFGGAAAWRKADPDNWGAGPRIGILGAYGSFLCELEWNESFLTAALTTEHTIASFYDFEGLFPYGGLYRGETLGDCGRLAASRAAYISNVLGDPTITIVRTPNSATGRE